MSMRPPPPWPYCGHGADPATDPIGCRGIHVPGHTGCLAHLTDTDRDTYLAGLTPGIDIDHRSTPFTEDLLNRLLTAVHDPTTQLPHFGPARFGGAQFSGDAWFGGAQFSGDALFGGAQFVTVSWWGPVVCAGVLDLSGAVFGAPVTLEIAAREVRCTRTRWDSTATARVRHASVDLGYAVLAAPAAVTAHPIPFTPAVGYVMDENLLAGPATVRVVSVQGVDAALLVLTDIDLSDCLFSGAFHLGQIRLEGRTFFAPTPTGWHRRGLRPLRWTRRRSLVEEHHWRAQTAGQPAPPAGQAPSPREWRTGPHYPDLARTPDPDDVAALYRQLRKAFEDGKNEPGGADFYYGECEMRRHDPTGTTRGERRLLWGYWLLSGYGLRASRAFT